MKDEQIAREFLSLSCGDDICGVMDRKSCRCFCEIVDALATARRAGFDAAKEQAADELGRQLAAAEAALQSSKLDCLSLETQLAETQARLAKAVEALREIDGHLTNMQPKLVNGPLALDKDRLAMVDRYVEPAILTARSVLSDLDVKDDNG